MNHVIDVIFSNDFSHWKPLIAFLIWSAFAFLKSQFHINKEVQKPPWEWILQTLFGDDDFDVRRLDNWFHHQIWEAKINLYRKTFL